MLIYLQMLTSYIRVGARAQRAGRPAHAASAPNGMCVWKTQGKGCQTGKETREWGRGIGKGQKKTTTKKQQNGEFKRLSSLVLLLVFSLDAESSAAFYDRPFALLSCYSRPGPDEGFKANDDFFKSFSGNHLPECQRVTWPAVRNVALMRRWGSGSLGGFLSWI